MTDNGSGHHTLPWEPNPPRVDLPMRWRNCRAVAEANEAVGRSAALSWRVVAVDCAFATAARGCACRRSPSMSPRGRFFAFERHPRAPEWARLTVEFRHARHVTRNVLRQRRGSRRVTVCDTGSGSSKSFSLRGVDTERTARVSRALSCSAGGVRMGGVCGAWSHAPRNGCRGKACRGWRRGGRRIQAYCREP
jgi:hypothetical protein